MMFQQQIFPKIEKNSIFPLNFHQKFSKFSQNFPNDCVFVQTRENLRMALKFLCQIGENTAFLLLSSGFFCKFSKFLRRPWGSAPRTPYEAGPPILNLPRNFFLRTPLMVGDRVFLALELPMPKVRITNENVLRLLIYF